MLTIPSGNMSAYMPSYLILEKEERLRYLSLALALFGLLSVASSLLSLITNIAPTPASAAAPTPASIAADCLNLIAAILIFLTSVAIWVQEKPEPKTSSSKAAGKNPLSGSEHKILVERTEAQRQKDDMYTKQRLLEEHSLLQRGCCSSESYFP